MSKDKKKKKDKVGGLKINKRQKKNFDDFQKGFKSPGGILRKMVIAAVFCFWMCGTVAAQEAPVINNGKVRLAWNPNTEHDLAGYKMYSGIESGNYDNVIDIGNHASYTAKNLVKGQKYYLAITAYDTSGNESGYSKEVVAEAKDLDAPVNPAGWHSLQEVRA